ISTEDWVPKDFGKPNIERFGPTSQVWQPSLSSLRAEENAEQHRIVATLNIRDVDALQAGRAAFPQRMFLELLLPKSQPQIQLNFYWFAKPATRLPEALWLTFRPVVVSQEGWTIDKCGEEISPFDVVPSGGRHMHAVERGFRYREQQHEFSVELLDAPLIALGKMSPLGFSRSQPDLSAGIPFSPLTNTLWANY